jgi:type II secretory pathway pseudopilin PulG
MMASIGMTPLLLILLAIAAVVAIVIGKMASLKSAVKDATDVGTEAVNQATKAAQTMQQTQQGARRSVGYANGTKYAAGGVAWVGVAGPELVRLPGGSQVYTNAESKGMVGGNTYINVTVPIENLKQIFDVVEWSNGLKQKYRQGGVRIG